ncbi:MAG: SIS domain-containing protein [Candidatus Azambacteria bacterium]|nr:SIS domain-containing protein [Candidatus Azambacteria bacterium]
MTTNNVAAEDYFKKFLEILAQTVITWRGGSKALLNDAICFVIGGLLENRRKRKKILVVGNGGSAAIAIHTLTDYANAGGLNTMDFNSPAMLTCMANDYGYENVFARPVELFAKEDDILFAISSSGKSPNILKACQAGREKGCHIYTFSGFEPDNSLRSYGVLNFYVPSNHYGFVEIAHQALIHCILDLFVERKNQKKY